VRVESYFDKFYKLVKKSSHSSLLFSDRGTEALEYVGMAAIVTPALASAAGLIKLEILGAYSLIKFW
jgi:hypothetical protein